MTAKTAVHPLLIVLSSFIEFIFKPFVRRYRSAPQDVETFPQFENDARETVHELAERAPIAEVPGEITPVFLKDARNHSPEVLAPKGVAFRKSVMFLARSGKYHSAKVVGWEGDGTFILSRKNGPRFRRQLSVAN